MQLNTRQKKIAAAVEADRETILSVAHQIHAHPELGYEEKFAAGLLTETLEQFGFTVERSFGGMPTAFCARKGSRPGPRVAIFAEYDALPGIGHACGHNVIAGCAVAAAVGLSAVLDELEGELWVIGTPAEETDGGKVVMAHKGLFNGIDAAMMIHPSDGNYKITRSLAMDALQVEFIGEPAHAASAPWEGKNALDAMLLTFNNINALRQRVRPDARIHGVITRGGAVPNIIPEYTAARFYIRAAQRGYLDRLVEQFKACAEAAALATETTVEFSHYENSFDDIATNMPLADRLHDYLSGVSGFGPFEYAPYGYGSADLGNVSYIVPATQTLLDISGGKPITHHKKDFCDAAASPAADRVVLEGGKAMAFTGCDLLTDPAYLKQVRDAFTQALGYAPGGR